MTRQSTSQLYLGKAGWNPQPGLTVIKAWWSFKIIIKSLEVNRRMRAPLVVGFNPSYLLTRLLSPQSCFLVYLCCICVCVRERVTHFVLVVQLLSHVQLWPHGLQHTRLPCPSLFPRVCSNSCPLKRWCHPTSSSSVTPLSSCLQSFPASGSFPVSQLFPSGGQSIGASVSASVFLMNIQAWLPLELIYVYINHI